MVKDLLDVVSAVSVAVDTYDKVMANGKIDLLDIKELPSLLVAVKDAVQGFKDIPVELKDATPEELGEVVLAVGQLVQKIAAHVK